MMGYIHAFVVEFLRTTWSERTYSALISNMPSPIVECEQISGSACCSDGMSKHINFWLSDASELDSFHCVFLEPVVRSIGSESTLTCITRNGDTAFVISDPCFGERNIASVFLAETTRTATVHRCQGSSRVLVARIPLKSVIMQRNSHSGDTA